MQKGIKEFLETKGKNVRPDTFRSYHSYLKWFNGFLHRSGKMQMPVKTFIDRDAEKAMKELGTRTDIGPATYNSYLEFFRNLFNYFINRNWVKEKPFNRISKRKKEQKRRDLIPPHSPADIDTCPCSIVEVGQRFALHHLSEYGES